MFNPAVLEGYKILSMSSSKMPLAKARSVFQGQGATFFNTQPEKRVLAQREFVMKAMKVVQPVTAPALMLAVSCCLCRTLAFTLRVCCQNAIR